jgi:D-glycero-D-manno-heptose 1,7-bisphosphate phosphatase
MNRAVFLDRDGVLNRIVWRDGKAASPRTVEELVIEPEAPAALSALRAAGFLLFVVTNQPDVRRGLMAKSALDAIHSALRDALPVDEIAVCDHDNTDDCACRKPRPGMLLDLARRHDLDMSSSIMVGDQDRDIACGRAAGCATVLLARPYNAGAGADHVVDDLSQALSVIIDAAPIPTPVPF